MTEKFKSRSFYFLAISNAGYCHLRNVGFKTCAGGIAKGAMKIGIYLTAWGHSCFWYYSNISFLFKTMYTLDIVIEMQDFKKCDQGVGERKEAEFKERM